MTDALLQVDNLTVDYADTTAVDDVSFSIEAGMVYGLIGPNGAGKTSTMRAIAGLVAPTWGRVRVGDHELTEDPDRVLREVGFMPDFPPLYGDLTVREFLNLFASAFRIPPERRRGRVDELLERMKLTEKAGAACGSLSRGMKQRLFLAKTLLHEPDVLLLDEPASGLDPNARRDLAAVLRQLGESGKAVLVSSHILSEMTDFCNSVGIMEKGRMVVSGRVEDVLDELRPGRSFSLRLAQPAPGLDALLDGEEHVTGVMLDGLFGDFLFTGDDAAAAALLAKLVGAGFAVAEFREEEHDLEDIFRQVSSGEVS